MGKVRYWIGHYVNRSDPGDLVWGYRWRECVWVDDGSVNRHTNDFPLLESNMFDKETGQNVGDTRNFCLNPYCSHKDCGPAVIIYEDKQ